MKQPFRKSSRCWLAVCLLASFCLAGRAAAGPLFDTSTPISFFTNVAGRLLASQMNVNLGRIQIYPTNQYTPAVHRLLQMTANILDAGNTNFYPTVFRPLFSADGAGNIFICGYQQVTSVSGLSDPQLEMPYTAAQLQTYIGTTPIANANGPVNVYGVPWVLGAKKGLPNFNQLSLVTAVQVTRKLEVTRNTFDPTMAQYATNQMYIMGISNNLGINFWNSYNAAYPRPVTVFASDMLATTLSNTRNQWRQITNFANTVVVSAWPGAQWNGTPPNSVPATASILALSWPSVFLAPTAYNFATAQFDPLSQWQMTTPPLPQLPQFGLSVTNCLQAYILDGSNVIDYVQLCSPDVSGGLNQALADPDYPQAGNVYSQWSTNAFQGLSVGVPYGAINQLWVSGHPYGAPAAGGQWSTAPTPMGDVSPSAEALYFNGFFTPAFQYNGQPYVNHQLAMPAPYTPTRTLYVSFLLQANDPLVHYLASDLNGAVGAPAVWGANRSSFNGVWNHVDDLLNSPLPLQPVSPLGGRYQPWGRKGQMAGLAGGVDVNLYNPAYKDPLVWGSDNWNFPTGQVWNLSWIGQVHRGTPWQTIYLKSTNVLSSSTTINGPLTWAAWTGDVQLNAAPYADAISSAPLNDLMSVGLLSAMLNTNDLRTQFSVNSTDPNAWAAELDGMVALTNTLPRGIPGAPLQFSSITISSNSVQAAIMANAILSTVANSNLFPARTFQTIGQVLATPQLSVQSPFLNLSGTQPSYGINDQAYEAIPSQLLPLLRVDAVGKMTSTNGQVQVQFTGYAGHDYAVQASSDLLNWTSVGTNSPVNGGFEVALPAMPNAASQFYRSVLIR